MREFEFPSMEHVALEISPSSIDGIARNRVAEVFQVNADLVCAAGLGLALHEGLALSCFKNAVTGEGIATSFDDGHFLSMDGMASDRRLDGAVRHAGRSIDKGEVGFFHAAGGELVGEQSMGGFGFGDDEATGGFLVEAMDDARALRASHDFDSGAVVEKSVGKSAFAVARAWMDNKSCGFVEHKQMRILEQNPERHFLGREGRGGSLDRNVQFHRVAFAQLHRGF